MANNTYVVSAILTREQRRAILDAVPPLHGLVHATQLTWIYNFQPGSRDHRYPLTELSLVLNEVWIRELPGGNAQVVRGYLTDGTQAWHRRPDGRHVEVTVSVDPGVKLASWTPAEMTLLHRLREPVVVSTHLFPRRASRSIPAERSDLAA